MSITDSRSRLSNLFLSMAISKFNNENIDPLSSSSSESSVYSTNTSTVLSFVSTPVTRRSNKDGKVQRTGL
ncbi:unnamed protein product [Brachionus calyciflorus]|uniref:Uncharacterized protein n=1 Tax=Brachionus calyciflorus TaxID=104777 RepID=A0A814JXU3_9BILA|nr:unnamed protein product [Brachionus calyciflorus]